MDEASNTSQILIPGQNDEMKRIDDKLMLDTNNELRDSDDKGLFGFFKKTFSSVRKTFENTFQN
jgi:hypothetical protein